MKKNGRPPVEDAPMLSLFNLFTIPSSLLCRILVKAGGNTARNPRQDVTSFIN